MSEYENASPFAPPHLVGLIRPVEVRHSVDAEDEHSEDEVPEA